MASIDEKEMKKIIGETQCPKDFICYTSEFEILGKARDVGLQTFIECLAEDSYDCPFSIRLHGLSYCKCSVRVHIAKSLGK